MKIGRNASRPPDFYHAQAAVRGGVSQVHPAPGTARSATNYGTLYACSSVVSLNEEPNTVPVPLDLTQPTSGANQ